MNAIQHSHFDSSEHSILTLHSQ